MKIIALIFLFQTLTGIVEGIKNIQVPRSKLTTEYAYHWWRIAQDVSFLFALFVGVHHLTFHNILIGVLAWIGLDAWNDRVIMRVAWNDWNYNWQPAHKPWWTYLNPTVGIDWLRFAVFTGLAVIFS